MSRGHTHLPSQSKVARSQVFQNLFSSLVAYSLHTYNGTDRRRDGCYDRLCVHSAAMFSASFVLFLAFTLIAKGTSLFGFVLVGIYSLTTYV